jgi:hypothetical protein
MTSTAHPNVFSSQSEQFSSPYVSVSGNESELPAKYEYHVQSSCFCEDDNHYDEKEIDTLVLRNPHERVTQVGEILAANLFSDTAFGFPINDQFLSNFFGSFLSSAGLFIPTNFATEKSTCVFLN